MKTNFKKLFLLAIILLVPNLVSAASSCSYEEQVEINNIVANVKANYEVVDIYAGKSYDVDNANPDGTFPEVDKYVKGFNISILNITDDIYVKVRNDFDTDEKTYYYKDTQDGIVTFQTRNKSKLINYTVEVYSNKYSCIGEKFYEFSFTTPMFNNFSERPQCIDNRDFYYCQEFISSENISFVEFNQKIKEYEQEKKQEEEQKENQNKSFIEKLKELYNNNKVIVYSIFVVIVVTGVAATVILIKRKRSRVL